MKLSEFIRKNNAAIIAEWEAFASSFPPAWQVTRAQLRNNITGLLNFIADDLRTYQTAKEQSEKSKGHGPHPSGESAAENHAEQRFRIGFDTLEMISEFRALRASIIKLWRRTNPAPEEMIDDIIRFNEAIDQLMAESLARYQENEQRARGLFLGTLIHDIRNPLNAISQASELIRALDCADDKHEKLATQIGRSTKRISQLVSEIIDAVRVRIGQGLPVNKSPMNLEEVALQVASEIQVAHPDRKIALDAAGNTDGNWDSGRIAQMVSNLIGNAVQHGAPNAPINVRLSEKENKVFLSVHNTGDPIPPDILPLVFDPLRKGKMDAPSTGTSMGLGLFITREIVAAHHGHITVTSTRDGTTFDVCLPKESGERCALPQ